MGEATGEARARVVALVAGVVALAAERSRERAVFFAGSG